MNGPSAMVAVARVGTDFAGTKGGENPYLQRIHISSLWSFNFFCYAFSMAHPFSSTVMMSNPPSFVSKIIEM